MDIFCTLLPSHLLVLLVLLLLLPSTPQAAPPSSIKGDRKGSHRQRLCYSWKFNVEVNNLRGWSNVPDSCESYVASYMTGNGYLEDSKVAISQALDYATSYNFSLLLDTENEIGHGEGEGRRSSSSSSSSSPPLVWIFDIDETSLSNLPYYAHHHFGVEAYNDTLFEAWVEQGIAPALPSSLKLFNKLRDLGFLVFFLTGRSESQRNVTVENLKTAGYHGWEGLILRQTEDHGVDAIYYKSGKRKALQDLGYVIVGNIGDQWSDITGYSVGSRVFKLPNPMYYIS